MTSSEAPTTRRTWLGLAVLLLPVLLISMDIGVLYFAVPSIDRDLAPSATAQLWILDAYGFVLAGLLVTMGAVGDRIGRRRLLMLGAAAFGAASLLAAWAPSAGALIAARALLGVAGATLMPSTLGLIRSMFHRDRDRRIAIACWTAGSAGGVALGPVVGGVLLQHFWWGSVFLINVPAAVLLLVLAPLLLPEHRAARPARFDARGSATSLVAVLATVYGLKQLAVDGASWPAIASAAVGLLVGASFVRRSLRIPHPLIDLRLFRTGSFAVANGVTVACMFAIAGSGLFTTQYLQLVRGLSALDAALYGLPATVAVMLGATAGAVLAGRLRPVLLLASGLLLAAGGFVVLGSAQGASGLATVVTGATLLAGGAGVALPLAADIVVASGPKDRAGAVSAISETSSEIGGAVGIAVLGSIGAAVYRHATASGMPDGTPAAARETLAGAVSASTDGPSGGVVLDVGRDAFVQALHVVSLAGAGLLAASAVGIVAVVLTSGADRGTADPDPGPAEDGPPSPAEPQDPERIAVGEATGTPA